VKLKSEIEMEQEGKSQLSNKINLSEKSYNLLLEDLAS
jgi:hypothetical protein